MKARSARALVVISVTELRRRLADRSILISSLVAPAIIAAIIGFSFAGAGAANHVRIGIALERPTAEARAVVTAGVRVAGLGSQVEIVSVRDTKQLRAEISSGYLGAGVVVPGGFADARSFGIPARQLEPGILADVTIGTGNGPPGARLTVVSASTSSLDGQMAEALAAAISSRIYAGALVTALSPGAASGAGSGAGGSGAGGSGAGGSGAATLTAARVAAAEPVPLELVALDIGNGRAVIGYYGSSIAVVFLFIGAGLGTRAIAMERSGGTLTRLAAAPVSSTLVVVGKMLAVFVTAIAGLLVLWAETVLVFGATWGGALGVLVMCAAATLAMCSLAMFLTSLARDESQAFAASIIVGIVLGILGGNFFPPGSLPGVLQVVSLATPNGWALVGFGRLALLHAGVSGVVGPLVVLGVISAVLVAAAGLRIRRVVEL